MAAKYTISVWKDGDPEVPEVRVLSLPDDFMGSASAEVERIEAELRDLQSDGIIDMFTITPESSNDCDLAEIQSWLEELRGDDDGK